MISVFDLQQVITKWQERADSHTQPFAYKTGISECIFELNQLINKSIDEELSYQDFLATEHFSNIEPEEFYAEAV